MNEKDLKKILYHHAINTTDVLGEDCMAIYDDVFDNLAKAIMDKIREELNITKTVDTSCMNLCIHNVSVNQCLKGDKHCCNLLYISNDYVPRKE